MLKHFFLSVTVCFLAFLMTGCATAPKSGVSDRIFGYSLDRVEVTISKDAYTGFLERLDNIDDRTFSRQVKEQLETVMTETVGPSFSGKVPALVLVHVDEMNIASGVGRAILGSPSFIGARVTVVGVFTKKVISERHFREQEKDVSFSGNLGGLIELTKNIIDATTNDRVEEAAREFAERVKRWLDA